MPQRNRLTSLVRFLHPVARPHPRRPRTRSSSPRRRARSHIRISLRRCRPRQPPHRIHKLLGRHPPRPRPAPLGRSLTSQHRRSRLIGLRRADQPDQLLQIISSRRKLRRQPVQQTRMPRRGLHRIHRMHNPSSRQPVPHTIHNRPRKPPVLRMRHQSRQLLQPLIPRQLRIHLTNLRKQPRRCRLLPRRHITTMQLQRLVRINRRQSIRIAQLPAVNEAVVTRRTLQIDAQKHLAHTLRKLHRHNLPRTHRPAPLDPARKPFAPRRRRYQFPRKHVVRLVPQQRLI